MKTNCRVQDCPLLPMICGRVGMPAAAVPKTLGAEAAGLFAPPMGIEAAAAAFVAARCQAVKGSRVFVGALFAAWREWCEQHQIEPRVPATLGRLLRHAAPWLKLKQNHARGRFYDGLALRPATAAAAAGSGS